MSPKQKRYIEWLALPPEERNPKTDADLAADLNRRPAALQRWRNEPGFQQAVDEAIRQRLYARVSKIYDVIGEKAESGDFRFIKLVLEMLGLLSVSRGMQTRPRANVNPVVTLEAYKQACKRIAAWKQETFGDEDEEDEKPSD